MKRSHIYLIIASLLLVILSCQKEPEEYLDTAGIATYSEFMENLVLDCPPDSSKYFFHGIIAGQETCYKDSVDGRVLIFGITSRFTTPGPSFSTGDSISNARKGARLEMVNSPYYVQGEDFITINFPDFELQRDPVAYLDSLFAIETHDIRSDKDDSGKFWIEIVMIDIKTESSSSNGGLAYSISTRHGPQEDSYIRIRKVEKTEEKGAVYFYIEMEVECKLYHFPQWGMEGLWGRIEDGLLVAKFPVK